MDAFPLADEANPDDFEWAFVSLPLSNSTPLMVQPKARAEWAKLFLDLGFRWHPELATKKVRPAVRGQEHTLNGCTRVMSVDEPDPEPIRVPDPEDLTEAENAFLLDRLRYLGRIGEPAHEVPVGERLDPSKHSAATVLGYLMGCDDRERRRVIAAEMCGDARDEILDRYRGL